jgi:hypothetical protein
MAEVKLGWELEEDVGWSGGSDLQPTSAWLSEHPRPMR